MRGEPGGRSAGAFRRDVIAREASPQPVSARAPPVASSARATAGVAVARRPDVPARPPNEFVRSAPAPRFRDSPGPRAALARAPEEPGPPPAPLREKEMRSAAPEVLSASRPLFRGGHYPQLVPNLWKNGPRLFNLRALPRTDGASGVRGLGLFHSGGFPPSERIPRPPERRFGGRSAS